MTTTLSTPLTPNPATPAAARKVLGQLARLRHGSLSIQLPGGTVQRLGAGEPAASITLHNWKIFRGRARPRRHRAGRQLCRGTLVDALASRPAAGPDAQPPRHRADGLRALVGTAHPSRAAPASPQQPQWEPAQHPGALRPRQRLLRLVARRDDELLGGALRRGRVLAHAAGAGRQDVARVEASGRAAGEPAAGDRLRLGRPRRNGRGGFRRPRHRRHPVDGATGLRAAAAGQSRRGGSRAAAAAGLPRHLRRPLSMRSAPWRWSRPWAASTGRRTSRKWRGC